jgi:hypothetical protein
MKKYTTDFCNDDLNNQLNILIDFLYIKFFNLTLKILVFLKLI